jgi:hypothetical protein
MEFFLTSAAITLATAVGCGDDGDRGRALGSLADAAGFRSIHSHRTAAASAPDRIVWICRIVAGDKGLHLCGRHSARAQS